MVWRSVAVTRLEGRVVVESLSRLVSGPGAVPNGWARVLEVGVGDEPLGDAVIAGLAEAGSSLPGEPVWPAAEAFGAENDLALAVPGAARVVVDEFSSSLTVCAVENQEPAEGFVAAEHPDERELLDWASPLVVGMTVRLALEDATA